MMLFLSKQAKKSSRAVQHARRDCRLGASKAPSAEGLGDAGWAGVVEKKPMGQVGRRIVSGWLVGGYDRRGVGFRVLRRW